MSFQTSLQNAADGITHLIQALRVYDDSKLPAFVRKRFRRLRDEVIELADELDLMQSLHAEIDGAYLDDLVPWKARFDRMYKQLEAIF